MQTRSIEIDFDVHKAIEIAKSDFSEPENSVLRRLLGIDKEERMVEAGLPWIGKGQSKGLTLPHGTQLRLRYNTTNLDGTVENGALVFNGERFPAPSSVRHLCPTKAGRVPNLNGKKIIEAQLPGTTEWVRLDALQRRMKGEAKAQTER